MKWREIGFNKLRSTAQLIDNLGKLKKENKKQANQVVSK